MAECTDDEVSDAIDGERSLLACFEDALAGGGAYATVKLGAAPRPEIELTIVQGKQIFPTAAPASCDASDGLHGPLPDHCRRRARLESCIGAWWERSRQSLGKDCAFSVTLASSEQELPRGYGRR